jgi:uncharacterized protein with PQ loop repeat
MWQDVTILGIGLVFGFLLIPQIIDLYKNKTALNIVSCVATTAALAVLGFVYSTLGLWLAVIGETITTIAWLVLTVQSVRNNIKTRLT